MADTRATTEIVRLAAGLTAAAADQCRQRLTQAGIACSLAPTAAGVELWLQKIDHDRAHTLLQTARLLPRP
jgi:hypothetical protein